jgi:hypothetical protein
MPPVADHGRWWAALLFGLMLMLMLLLLIASWLLRAVIPVAPAVTLTATLSAAGKGPESDYDCHGRNCRHPVTCGVVRGWVCLAPVA